MKKISIALLAASFFISCNNEKKADETAASPIEEKKQMVALPYMAEYSDFSIGDQNHTKMVLDFFKMFEENRLNDGRSFLTDTVAVDFPDGSKFMGTADSLIKLGIQYRKMYGKLETKVDACLAVHSNDKNEDWVLIWDRTYNTDEKGKVDSTRNQSYWQIKNNKITYWGEYKAPLAQPPASK
jgi:hypothetical protein